MTGRSPRFAVIGTGAAAFGVMTALQDSGVDADVVILDIGEQVIREPEGSEPSEEWIQSFYDGIYRTIRQRHPRSFPPPKTHFAQALPRLDVGNRWRIFRSEAFGGLTNYWGATMLPFTSRELRCWPLEEADLAPHYQTIAQRVGLAGRADGLNHYFVQDYCNRPPLLPTAGLTILDQLVNEQEREIRHGYRVVSGVNRCAVETRTGHEHGCVYCGECLAGCFRGSIFNTAPELRRWHESSPRVRFVKGRVLAIEDDGSALRYRNGTNEERESGFDAIFLCAGCVGSTEILLRSAGIQAATEMADNAVYVFPILYTGVLPPSARSEAYASLSNIILACIPETDGDRFAQAQIYPNFDYLWRYNVPPPLWPALRPLVAAFRSRLSWGRLYVHSDVSQAYSLLLKQGELELGVSRQARREEQVKRLMRAMREAVGRRGFWIPPVPPIRQRTNSHYAATLPFENELLPVARSGQVLPRVFVCDSTCFPESPAVSPTFTIMANALRVATEVIHG